jgi:hypothetical protein
MDNGMKHTTRLGAVRPGDVLTLQQDHFRVLTSQRRAGVMTLELEDAPEHPLTLIGVPSMTVTLESRSDSPDPGPVSGRIDGAVTFGEP